MPSDPQLQAQQRPVAEQAKPALTAAMEEKPADAKKVDRTPAATAATSVAPAAKAPTPENPKVAAAARRIVDGEIRVSTLGRLANYVATAATLFLTEGREDVTLKATGNAIGCAINLAELLKRRIAGLHQQTTCGSTAIARAGATNANGEEVSRNVSYIEIKLSRTTKGLDTAAAGYQEPLDAALVKELPAAEIAARRGRPRPGPRGRGRYRGGRYMRGRRQDDNASAAQEDPSRRRGPYRGRGGRGNRSRSYRPKNARNSGAPRSQELRNAANAPSNPQAAPPAPTPAPASAQAGTSA